MNTINTIEKNPYEIMVNELIPNEYPIFDGTREEYLTKGYNDFLVSYFKEKTGYELPQVFVSSTSKYRANTKTLADCTRFSDRIEISINANKVYGHTVEDSLRIWDIVIHEGIHACGIKGHKKDFAELGKKLGLQGGGDNNKMWTCTQSTEQLDEIILKNLISKLGLYPQPEFKQHATKPKAVRNLKVVCSEDCGYSHRQALKTYELLQDRTCGACGEGQLIIE